MFARSIAHASDIGCALLHGFSPLGGMAEPDWKAMALLLMIVAFA